MADAFSWDVPVPDAYFPTDAPVRAEARANWHTVSLAFHDYWWAKRAALGRFPDRADLEPLAEVPRLCPYIVIWEPSPGPGDLPDLFCRLAGTHVEAAQHRPITGLFASTFVANPNSDWRTRVERVALGGLFSIRRLPPRVHTVSRIGVVESFYAPISDRRRGRQAAMGVTIYQRLE
jgi:hypothetical protein